MTKDVNSPEPNNLESLLHKQLLKYAEELSTTYKNLKREHKLLVDSYHQTVLSERQAAFGQLVQGIVHNMRNPLNVITMSFEILEDKLTEILKIGAHLPEGKIEELEKVVSKITNLSNRGNIATKRLEEMLNSMMLRGKRDKSSIIEDVDLNDIILQEVEFMDADYDFKYKIEKTIELNEKQLRIEVVSAEIAQVIQNLLRNAIDAMHFREKKKLKIISLLEKDNAVLRIADNGSGIPGEIQSKIFDPFFTTKPKVNDEKKGNTPTGTGLGLWMCKETIESYRGSIGIKSYPEEGSEFTIRFPLKQ